MECDFNKDSREKSGIRSQCKDCTRQDHIRYNMTHKRNKDVEYKAIKAYKERNEHKRKAQRLLSYAVKKGLVKKDEHCRFCYCKTVEAHHDDYSQPYDVVWLCRLHHKERHWNNKHMDKSILPRI